MTESEADPAGIAKFDAAMEDIYYKARREIGYNATRFLVMVKERGGLGAAHHLLPGDRIHDGFAELALAGRPDKVDATMESDDVVLTVGTLRMGIVLTDDCEIASLAGAREHGWEPRGRILMAAIRKDDGKDRDDLELGIHALPPDDDRGFPGGLVDFTRLYAVQTKSLVSPPDDRLRKVASLNPDAKYELGERFAGHLLRQGPVAAELGARKLSRLLTAGEDVARLRAFGTGDPEDWGSANEGVEGVVKVLAEAWFLGRLFDLVDDLAERTIAGELVDGEAERQELRRKFAVSLRAIAEEAAESANALSEQP